MPNPKRYKGWEILHQGKRTPPWWAVKGAEGMKAWTLDRLIELINDWENTSPETGEKNNG